MIGGCDGKNILEKWGSAARARLIDKGTTLTVTLAYTEYSDADPVRCNRLHSLSQYCPSDPPTPTHRLSLHYPMKPIFSTPQPPAHKGDVPREDMSCITNALSHLHTHTIQIDNKCMDSKGISALSGGIEQTFPLNMTSFYPDSVDITKH